MVHASNLRGFSDHELAIAFFLDDGQRFHTFVWHFLCHVLYRIRTTLFFF